MGEVYRARDTRLERTVAIKILPAEFSSDPTYRQRFEREAKTISSLNHPHICTLHDIGHQDGIDYLVMERVEGETLAKRLEKGPLALEQVLKLGAQIADALEKAHRSGVVHRDLKPGNIMVTPSGAKLMDFGLAKPAAPVAGLATLTASKPESPVTERGTIVGTFQYMSPEQIEGKELDGRSDIFSLGAVLYEMVTGKKAFEGKSQLSVASAILEKEPAPVTSLKPMTPAALDHAVRCCLAKDPEERWQIARDLANELKWIGEAGSQASAPAVRLPRRAVRAVLWPLAAAAIVFGSFAGYLLLQPKEQGPVVRFSFSPPENTVFSPSGGYVSLSPDGHKLAFVTAPSASRPQLLWVRPLDSLTAQPLWGTEGAALPFWSPDSDYLGFYSGGKLEKVAASGGPVQTLCDADGAGATWSRDGVIVFTSQGRLYRVSDAGGTPVLVAAPDTGRGETDYRYPQFLPDGKHFLFLVRLATARDFSAVCSLDSKQTQRLLATSSNALFSPPGYLFYLNGSMLTAQPFDAKTLRFTGQAAPVAENVGVLRGSGYGFFAVSASGVLAYQSGGIASTSQMVWFNRNGQRLGTVGQSDVYSNPDLSPDGTRLAVGLGEFGERDIWVYDLKRGTGSRLTFNPADDFNPVWSPDGSRILFTSTRAGLGDIYREAANGLGNTELVLEFKEQAKKAVDDVSTDGRYAIYDTAGGPSSTELWALPLFGEAKPFAFVQGAFGARQARFSPNGRYIAYVSNETKRNEVYVQTFPQHLGKWQSSVSGGVEPMWRRDGKEVFYLSPDDKLMAVEVKTDSGPFQVGVPKPLFQAELTPASVWRNRYVVSSDGQRFLMFVPAKKAQPAPITVVVNWPALLKKQ